jgi:hypothetical protein
VLLHNETVTIGADLLAGQETLKPEWRKANCQNGKKYVIKTSPPLG